MSIEIRARVICNGCGDVTGSTTQLLRKVKTPPERVDQIMAIYNAALDNLKADGWVSVDREQYCPKCADQPVPEKKPVAKG